MSASEPLNVRLRAWEQVFRKQLTLIAPLSDPRSFGMRLLVSQPNKTGEPPFLKELRRVLCEGATQFGEEEGGCARREDLGEWLGPGSEKLHTPANWLKIKIEELPLRLFVAINPGEWSADGKSPLDGDAFWTSRDPFFRKRICWLDCRELIDNGPLALPQKPTENPVDDRASAIAWLQGLRLRWVRHLAIEVAGLWDSSADELQLNVLVSLAASDATGLPAQQKLEPPETVPLKWRDSGGDKDGRSGVFCLDLKNLKVGSKKWEGSVGLSPQDLMHTRRNVLFRRHETAAEYVAQEPAWHPKGTDFSADVNSPFGGEDSKETVLYFKCLASQHIVSGAGRSFSLLDAGLGQRSGANGECPVIVLDAAEQALLRLGIADERFQQWMWGSEERQRGWVVAQRVAPVFIAPTRTNAKNYRHGQPPYRGAPHYRIDPKHAERPPVPRFRCPHGLEYLWPKTLRGLDALVIHQGLLDKAFNGHDSRRHLTARMLELKAAMPFVFITSGRGRPENLPWGCKFLPYAAIEGAIHGPYFEKILLWRAMVAS